MNHKYISEFDLVDRYLIGKLAAEETAEFESHFVDCQECVGHLNETKALMDGLRVAASEQMVQRAGRQRKYIRWFPSGSSRWLLAASSAVVLVALVGAVLVSNQVRRSRNAAAQSTNLAAEWQRRYDEERHANLESERNFKTQLAELRKEAESSKKQNARERRNGDGGSSQPQFNLPIFILSSTRRADRSDAPNLIDLVRYGPNFVISVSPEGERYSAYFMKILKADGSLISQSRGLKPDPNNLLSVQFNSKSFQRGDYTVTVEGTAGDGSTGIVGKYSFRVVK